MIKNETGINFASVALVVIAVVLVIWLIHTW
jgi:hypothetical protein